jgi:hypothetical protein
MKYEKISPFYSGYLKTILSKKLTKKLKDLCLNNNKSIDEWDSYDFYEWNTPEIQELNTIQVNMTKEYMKTFNGTKNSDSFSFNGWVNIREDTSWHRPHIHNGTALIFNLYVSVPECTTVSFMNPDTIHGTLGNDMRIHTIKPDEGTMILTPGWWLHWTDPTFKNKKRISMSSNVTIH